MFKKKSSPKKLDPKTLEGRKFRFVVSSAEDAAKIIRERLGDTAKVLSVKQVNGKGLTKFLSSPQLEIIVTVPKSQLQVPKASEKSAPTNRLNTHDQPPKGAPAPKVETPKANATQPISQVLKVAGFDQNLIQSLKASANWANIQSLPLSHGLAEVTHSLKKQYNDLPQKATTSRIAFFGTPGSGTTSALCKKLASDVFLHKKTPSVLKLESETPNPDDALRIFCNVIGVPILNEAESIPGPSEDSPLYIDVTGANAKDSKQWSQVLTRLNELNIDTRVLVINAAYDAELIKSTLRLANSTQATHLVFSHIDEIPTTSKLWPFVLLSGLPILFLSSGQDVTGDIIEDVPDHLLQHSFPSILLN